MNNKSLVIQLIIQEFRHHQLIYGFRQLGFENDSCSFSLFEPVVQLMGVELDPEQDYKGNIQRLYDVYYDCISKSEGYSISLLNRELEPLAMECYKNLSTYVVPPKHNDIK